MSLDYRKAAQNTGHILGNLLKAALPLALYVAAATVLNKCQKTLSFDYEDIIPGLSEAELVEYASLTNTDSTKTDPIKLETRSRTIKFYEDYEQPFYHIRDEVRSKAYLEEGEEFAGRKAVITVLNYENKAYLN